MGATDEKNMTQFVIKALHLINEPFSVIIILGSGYQYKKDLENELVSSHYNYSIHKDPVNPAEIMSMADLGIISFGQTAYELVALKVPAIYLCLSNDHYNSAELFVNSGLGKSLGIIGTKTEVEIAKIINNILKNYSNQAQTQYSELLKGSTARIANIIMEDL
jgi:spore coat polysaccharide biosynthesis protein SpsF